MSSITNLQINKRAVHSTAGVTDKQRVMKESENSAVEKVTPGVGKTEKRDS